MGKGGGVCQACVGCGRGCERGKRGGKGEGGEQLCRGVVASRAREQLQSREVERASGSVVA